MPDNVQVLEGVEVEIANWHPTSDGSGPPAQVHLIVRAPGVAFALRFKSGRGLDKFIGDLLNHRQQVFGGHS